MHFTLHLKFYLWSFDLDALWIVWVYCKCKSFKRCLQVSGAGRWVRQGARVRSPAGGCAAAVTLKPWEMWRTAMTQTDPLHPNPRPRPPLGDRATWRPPSSLSASSSRLYRHASEWNTWNTTWTHSTAAVLQLKTSLDKLTQRSHAWMMTLNVILSVILAGPITWGALLNISMMPLGVYSLWPADGSMLTGWLVALKLPIRSPNDLYTH